MSESQFSSDRGFSATQPSNQHATTLCISLIQQDLELVVKMVYYTVYGFGTQLFLVQDGILPPYSNILPSSDFPAMAGSPSDVIPAIFSWTKVFFCSNFATAASKSSPFLVLRQSFHSLAVRTPKAALNLTYRCSHHLRLKKLKIQPLLSLIVHQCVETYLQCSLLLSLA